MQSTRREFIAGAAGVTASVLLGSGARAHSANERLGVGLIGCGGGKLAPVCDIAIIVPSDDIPRIQEVQIAVGHLLCDYAEASLFGG